MIYSLFPHPDFTNVAVENVGVQLSRLPKNEQAIWLEFNVRLRGSMFLPDAQEPERSDGLWRTTCFEIFVANPRQPNYVEFNLSPSFQWAAYGFDDYRSGARDLLVPFKPEITIAPTVTDFWLAAEIGVPDIDLDGALIGLSAVIEQSDRTKSYWALAHAPGPPDFHNRDCFIATFPAPATR